MTNAMQLPDWHVLLAAVLADTADDTLRLAAADFLEENGDPDRARFIRIQIELAQLEATGSGKSLPADHLRAKERAFLGPLSMYRLWWAMAECPELVRMQYVAGGLDVARVDGGDQLTWRRGFIEVIRCRAHEWLRQGVAVRRRLPIQELQLTESAELTRDHWYALMPALVGLHRLDLVGEHNDSMVMWLKSRLTSVVIKISPA